MAKVKAKQIALADHRTKQLLMVDSHGRVWERFGGWDAGKWGEVELPSDPGRKQNGKLSRKRVS